MVDSALYHGLGFRPRLPIGTRKTKCRNRLFQCDYLALIESLMEAMTSVALPKASSRVLI
jgi:hypothetical protein